MMGWAGSCDNWKFQTDFFGKHGDFQVCIFENRGSGLSSSPKRNYSMSDMAHDALDLITHLGWKDKDVHVVGVSMGGMIAQELALLMDPKRIKSLTLASTASRCRLPPLRNMGWIMTAFAKIALGLASVKEKMPHFLYSQQWLKSPAPSGSGFASNLEYMLKFHGCRIQSRPPQSFKSALAQLYGILQHNIHPPRLQLLRDRLSIPAMVIHGTEDALVHLRNAWHLAKNIGARLVVLEGRAHAVNHEDIDTFNRLLLRQFYIGMLGVGRAEEAAKRAGWFLSSSRKQQQQGPGSTKDADGLEKAVGRTGSVAEQQTHPLDVNDILSNTSATLQIAADQVRQQSHTKALEVVDKALESQVIKKLARLAKVKEETLKEFVVKHLEWLERKKR
ncbi:hypothetical protein HDV05_007339 [Chytridiales sp. JEL 0842]|nr:hypothetical protein HDV05_007339 [Chytridiales sp. JEL 0842]